MSNAWLTAVLADSPASVWLLDEADGSGGALDQQGVNNGTYAASGVTYRQTPGPVIGSLGWPQFNGSAGYVNVGTMGSFASSTNGGGMTIELFVSTTSAGNGVILGTRGLHNWRSVVADALQLLFRMRLLRRCRTWTCRWHCNK